MTDSGTWGAIQDEARAQLKLMLMADRGSKTFIIVISGLYDH